MCREATSPSGGVIVGSFSGGAGGDFTVTLNAAATSMAVEALIENLTYANNSDAPTQNRTLTLNVTDDQGADLGAAGPASFTQLTGAANPFSGVQVAYSSAPCFVDFDGDGDLDAVVGTSYALDEYSYYYGRLAAFENDGAGNFTELTGAANPFDAVDVTYLSAPAFVDLDGDGDMDAVVGSYNGTLSVFENNGAGVFTELTGAANPFNGVDVGGYSAPTFVDLDGDGDMDAVVGERYGTLRSFANDGAGGFTELTGAANPFNGISIGFRSSPSFVDLDGDGDLDVVVGAFDGKLFVLDNGPGGFALVSGAGVPFDGVDVGNNSKPTFVDIDGDGDLDAVVGELYGKLLTFENTTPHAPAITVTVNAQDDSAVAIDDAFTTDESAALTTGNVFAANAATADSDPDSPLTVTKVNGSAVSVGMQITLASGALLTLNANGTFSYDPNGAFDALPGAGSGASNPMTATDSFTYELNGDSTATVTITVDGVDSEGDVLLGTAGNDTLNGGIGADTMTGGLGDDRYYVDNAGDTVVEAAGEGKDRVYTSVNFDATGLDIEELVVTGTAGLTLTAGDIDTGMRGGDGDDTLIGGTGNDTLYGRGGADTMTGGAGNDRYHVDNVGDTVNELVGGGIDTVYTEIDFDANGAEIEFIRAFTDNAVTLTASNIDTGLVGRAGDDTLIGGTGNDTLFGGLGADIMVGGIGDDRYFVDDAGDTVTEAGGEGRDVVYTSVDFDATGSEIEVIRARSDSGLTLTANDVGTSIAGRDGDDTLNGAAGRDTLQGGLGTDTLTGGASRDVFLFDDGDSAAALADADHITDFSQSDGDRINLSRIDAIDGGGDNAFSFIGEDAFHNVAGELRFEQVGGETHIFGDTDGNGIADFTIILDTTVDLVSSDFTL